jgi:acyl-CoA thioester hydrolase
VVVTARPAAGPVPQRSDFGAFWPVLPRWNDNDQYGHVNNATYYEYFDTAVNGWLAAQCGDMSQLDAIGLVAETGCRYLSSVSFPDRLEVGMGLERRGRSSVTYRLAVFAEGAAEPAAVGTFVHVYVDRQTRRPVPIPAPVGEALSRLEG